MLSDQEFDKYFMVAEAFFDHRQDIYAVSPDGSFYRSPTLFPTKEAVENFDRETSGAEIVQSAGAAAVLTHATRSRASVR